MSARGSKVVYCPACLAPHYADVMEWTPGTPKRPGVWRIACRVCGLVPWRARL